MFENFDLEALLETLSEISMTWGLSVVGAIVVLIVGRIAAGWFRSTVRRVLQKSNVDDTLAPFLSSLVYYLIIAFVVIAVLGLFGVPTASFIAVLGAAGLAVGFALQGTLGNFAAGVMLLVFRPFRIGDYIDAGGAAGTVSEISIFTTTLNTPDNVRITVPNSAVSGQTIKNFSANDTRRNDMVFGISYGDDIGKAMQIIQETLDQDERVLKDPAPVIAVGELADSSVNILVRPWCAKEDYWGLRFDMTRGLKEKLESAGCSIPFPQTDVHLFPQGSATTN
jgi:small conductance mechanosensitive channel